MDIFRAAERVMAMDDAAWRRHANPLSVWTRFTTLPALCLAFWSRDALGWAALGPIAAALGWVWLNPRLFSEPQRFDHWTSKGVLGERVFLEHRQEVPPHHLRAAQILAWASLPGLLIMGTGLIFLWAEGVVFGCLLAMLPKVWFVDRMVWIFDDWRRDGRPVPGMLNDEL